MHTQELVRWADEEEKQRLIARLEGMGFRNRFRETSAPNAVRAFCVDLKKKEFFGTNVTCAAARAQVGRKTLSAEEFAERYDGETTIRS